MSLSSSQPVPGAVRYGMVHGRFQPFHNGHLEYLRLALERCETLIVGITNPDPSQSAEDEASAHRHLDQSNPFTFFERQLMIREVIADEAIPFERVIFVPFPVNLPDRWRYYVPSDVVHYLRVFSPWEQIKADRLAAAGYRVEILQPGVEKQVEATAIRRSMSNGEPWDTLVPPGVARVVRALPARGAVEAAR